MSFAGLAVFDRTLQKTNQWLDEIGREMGTGDEQRQESYLAMRATLQTLRDRLVPEEAADLGAQLPMLVRGIYYEGWRPAKTPDKSVKSREAFLESVWSKMERNPRLNPEAAVKATLAVLSRRVSAGEIMDVKGMLPDEFADYWPPDGA
ncbi:MAG: DUF2267 domain-containing protein [Candidatus Krumholzibacteriia bacterium]